MAGRNTGEPSSGQGRGLGGGNKPGAGPSGFCSCPKCGEKLAHVRGYPCNTMHCPKCGTIMTRS